ncbi:MAG: potassium channel protein [Dehalococcoidales bacterium]|jgi:voltage-gated potassium channel
MYKKYIWCLIILVAIVIIGSIGYWLISGGGYSLVDYIYMTVITITTIGFGEVIDLAGNPGGRIFTMFIALAGIGVLAYVLTSATATVVEGNLTKSFRRRRMEKIAEKAKGHYIVCGMDWAGLHIVQELRETKRPHIIIEISQNKIEKSLETFPKSTFIEGDATDNDTLIKAGIERAAGLFAVLGDDNQNLVICFSARHLNPGLRIVAQCTEMRNQDKMKQAGADSIVSPGYISGMRMASEMIRPTVVSFLDRMMRGRDEALRVEEIAIPKSLAGKSFSSLNLKKYPRTLILAVKKGDNWIYNPSRNECTIDYDDKIIVMTTPEERQELEKGLENR